MTSVDKTQTYIRRSKPSPLRVHVEVYLDQALSLVIPQIPRLRSLTICTDAIPDALRHFRCRAPLLQDLVIDVTSPGQILDSALFDGDLSSLHELSLVGVTTDLPWTDMANLGILLSSKTHGHRDSTPRLPRVCPSPTHHLHGRFNSQFIRFPSWASCVPTSPEYSYHLRGSRTFYLKPPLHPHRRITHGVDHLQG